MGKRLEVSQQRAATNACGPRGNLLTELVRSLHCYIYVYFLYDYSMSRNKTKQVSSLGGLTIHHPLHKVLRIHKLENSLPHGLAPNLLTPRLHDIARTIPCIQRGTDSCLNTVSYGRKVQTVSAHHRSR